MMDKRNWPVGRQNCNGTVPTVYKVMSLNTLAAPLPATRTPHRHSAITVRSRRDVVPTSTQATGVPPQDRRRHPALVAVTQTIFGPQSGDHCRTRSTGVLQAATYY